MNLKAPLVAALMALALILPAAAEEHLAAFLEEHCIRCHGPEKQKSDLRFDQLVFSFADEAHFEIGHSIVEMLSAKEMPPEDEPQPSPEARAAFLDALQARISESPQQQKQSGAVLRRMNKAQYRNTISDLLGVDAMLLGLTDSFPADEAVDGFTNNGEGLVMSDFLLDRYLGAARTAVDAALESGQKTAPYHYRLADDEALAQRYGREEGEYAGELFILYASDERAPGDIRGQSLFSTWRLSRFPDKATKPHPKAGVYQITFEVESRGRGAMPEVFGKQSRTDYPEYFGEDLHRLEIYLSSSEDRRRTRHLVETIDLPDNKRQSLVRNYWMPAGWTVEFAFGNGPVLAGGLGYLEAISEKLPPEFEHASKRDQKGMTKETLGRALRRRATPQIVFYKLEERGPLPLKAEDSETRALANLLSGDPVDLQGLRHFARRAFRRPVSDNELAPFAMLARTHPEGTRAAVEAILCSPYFLYLYENEGKLDDYALASRLSYFLWNTQPDAALMQLAEQGSLGKPGVLAEQLERMLRDRRSDEFVRSFVWEWLNLENTREMPPDAEKFYEYYRRQIAVAMIGETEAFFRYLLDENLSLANFIDSKFTFLNADIARHYGVQGIPTSRFQKVILPPSDRRGGLLGQASVLTASANGVETSPVVRGVWVLDRLLGTPPSPPPDDVLIAEPDARGALTIREIYAKHRTIESCNACHRKIDPPGFALENFDPVGQWRQEYDGGNPIDSSGQLPQGQAFDDIVGMKQALLSELPLVARNVVERVMAYATGRTMTRADANEVNLIVDELESSGQGMRDLVRLVVTSEAFLTK